MRLLVNLVLVLALGLVVLSFVAPLVAAFLGAFPDGPL